MTKRLKGALIGGVLLGIVCVIGAYIRSGGSAAQTLFFHFGITEL